MPFGRRNKKKDFLNLGNIFNYLLNFSRTRKYISLSIKRMRASPNELALGLACGIAISFTPFIGLHALLGIFFAWVIRGSMAAALIGTLVGNPWTFPFIWFLTYEMGNLFYFYFLEIENQISISEIKREISLLLSVIKNIVIYDNFEEIKQNILSLRLIPIMTIGSIPFVLISWFLSYLILLNIIKSYKKTILERK